MGIKLRQAQTSFAAGEFTRLLAARDDLDAYRNGAEKFLNFAPLAQGGGRTRPATRFRAILNQNEGKLAPFVFNKTQRYVVVFSHERADIYLPDGTLATSLTGAPWTSAMLERLTWTQSLDTMIVFHRDMKPQVIKRTGATSFTLTPFAFETSGAIVKQPYYKYEAPDVTLTPSGTSGAITVTASSGIFSADWNGKKIRYEGKQITLGTYGGTPTQMPATADETLPGTTASANWDEQAFSSHRGWLNCGEFFADRLVLGGAKSRPTGIWLSKIGAYFNFDLGTGLDNEAIWEAVGGPRISEILHLVGARHLLIFGDQSFYYVPTSPSTPLTPKHFDVQEQQPYGASICRPHVFDSAVLFVQDSGAIVREAFWIDTEQAYTANAVSLRANHLISNPTQMAVLYGRSGQPEQYALLVNDDGTLAIFHSARAERIAAWVPWSTSGAFKSICTAGSEIFVLVERELAGGTTWTLEKFDDDAQPLDCSKRVTADEPTKIFTGFDHLAGKDVQVSTKGHPLGTYTVGAGGEITLDELAPEVTEIEAGFAFEQRVRPMPAVFDLPQGTTRGQVLGLVRSLIQVDESLGFTVDGNQILLRFQGDDFANPPHSETGILEVRHLGYDRNAQADLVVADPVKITLLGWTREVQVNG